MKVNECIINYCTLKGRIDAVQSYVDRNQYVSLRAVLDILGIGMDKYNARMKKDQEDYEKALKEGESDAGPDSSH